MASSNPAFNAFNLNGFSLRLPKQKSLSKEKHPDRSVSSLKKVPRPSTAPAIEHKPVLPSRPLPSSQAFEKTPADQYTFEQEAKQRVASSGLFKINTDEGSSSQEMLSGDGGSSAFSIDSDSRTPNTSVGELQSTNEESEYDWATFISAYARGNWDPHRTPGPPRSHFISPNHHLYSVPEFSSPSSAGGDSTEWSSQGYKSSSHTSTPSYETLKPLLTPAFQLPPDLGRGRMPLMDLHSHRQRNSFSASSSHSVLHHSPSNVDIQATAATLRWAAAHVNLAPLALPSPEHELTDPMRGVNAAIPGSHPPNFATHFSHDLLTPGGTRRLRPVGFWKGTQDIQDGGERTYGSISSTSSGTLGPATAHPSMSEVVPPLPPASAPTEKTAIDEDPDADYFGELDTTMSPDVASEEQFSIPQFPAEHTNATGPLLMRLGSMDSGTMSVPAIPRRICLTRQASSPLPNSMSIESSSAPASLHISHNTLSSEQAFSRARAAKEEQMFQELGFLAPPNPPEELERRRALYKYNIWNTGPDINFDRIAHLAKLVFNTKGVYISLVDRSESFYKSEWGLKDHSKLRMHSFCGHAILHRGDEPMVVLDAHEDWRFRNNPLVTGSPEIRFYAGAPLRTQDGYNIGTLAIIDSSPKEDFTPRQRHTLKEFAAIVIRELELWRDKIQLRIRDRIQTSMEQFSRECLEIDLGPHMAGESNGEPQEFGLPSMDQVYNRAARLIKRTLDVEGVMVMDVSYSDILENISGPSEGTVPVSIHRQDPKVSGGARKLDADEYRKLNSFFAKYPDGKIFEGITPPCLRPFLPLKIQYALAVPIFNVDKQPFALLCAYNAEGPTKRFLEGHELSYLRAIGVIILSAVLKRRMTLADKAKSLFISNISHELRTPLHGILAAAELLAESEMSHSQMSFLETVQACGTSLVETVNHVLDFTKLSGNAKAGGVENAMSPSDVDLLHLVEDAVDGCYVGFRARTAESGIGTFYSPPKDEGAGSAPLALVETVVDIGSPLETWWVKCEKSGIRRVLMNLFSNSLKFTTNGYVRVSLRQMPRTHDVPPDEVRIELSVADSGKGISQDFLKNQLFHPFTQENPLQTGTGLGLAIVNSIISSESVDGKVDVWSEEAVGTEIKITFSAKIAHSDSCDSWLTLPFKTDSGETPTVTMVGFNSTHPGVSLLRDTIKNYLDVWFGLRVIPEDQPPGQIILINDDFSPVVDAIAQRDIQHPFIIFSDLRGDPTGMAIASEYDSIGGFCRILYKPAGPSRLRSVIKLCLHALNISGFASADDLHMGAHNHHHSRSDSGAMTLARRKSEEGQLTRPALLPRAVTAHPLVTSWQTLPSTTEQVEPAPSPPVPRALDMVETSSPVEEVPTIPVGAGGTLLQSSMSSSITRSAGFRVLVVEDNTILRDLLSKWLTKKGYAYSVAVDGEDGVRIFEAQGPFDIVLLDLSMPLLDGFGASIKMRDYESKLHNGHRPRQRPTRILALTGMSTPEDKRKAFEAGVDGYLVKPVAFKTLDDIFSKLGFSS